MHVCVSNVYVLSADADDQVHPFLIRIINDFLEIVSSLATKQRRPFIVNNFQLFWTHDNQTVYNISIFSSNFE